MSAIRRILFHEIRTNFCGFKSIGKENRCLSTIAPATKDDSNLGNNVVSAKLEDKTARYNEPTVSSQYRFIYPEFLPDPDPLHRNALREKLERRDMIARRTVIDIPEFYVGSILSVTYSEPHAPGKSNKFVGICIQRKGSGLRAKFILRNVIDHQGIEVVYELYDPAIQKIDCLRLQKRLDDELLYLRDAPAEFSTFPFDMELEYLPEGSPVPVNDLKVPLKPQPWLERWERKNLKGVLGFKLTEKQEMKAAAHVKPWEKYDLMKIYRETIPEEQQQAIYAEIYTKLHTLELSRKKLKHKRIFVRPKKEYVKPE